jgi:hypothetical protein
MSSAERRLPDYAIIGAMKSGTSSLRAALATHPESFCARETHFFCENFERGIDWYLERFADAGDVRRLGEKTADYLYNAGALSRMKETIPGAQLIVMLRDPVDRAYSNYWHERRLGRETLSFADAVAAEPERLANGERHFGYLDMGRYLPQLERLTTLYPRGAIQVTIFEDFSESPASSFASVCRFLGIDDTMVPEALNVRHNQYVSAKRPWLVPLLRKQWFRDRLPAPIRRRIWGQMWKPAEYEPLDPALRRELAAGFTADNASLARWLGVDRMRWDAPSTSPEPARGSS